MLTCATRLGRNTSPGLYTGGSPILAELDDLGIDIGELRDAFVSFAEYPDVDEWPAPEIELSDLDTGHQAY